MQNLIDDLKEALLPDASLFEGGELLKNAVIERALRMDPELIGMLVASHRLKSHFFTDVGGVLVFDKVAFQRFVSNKAFLPDSYTAFRNRIGLMHGDGYLKQNEDVVLAWPFKDCVLEGGMTREDRGRQEVFWNEILAPDDISRLFEPKVMTNFQRWDEEAVASGMPKPVGQIGMDDNLLIKGNNLLALHTLKARYAGKVKLIYIDPPYNTGSDGFRYNDRFNHASWLTFMKNRLEVARELLSDDGVIVIILDDSEVHYCKVLMDEVFSRDNYCNTVCCTTNDPSGFKATGSTVFSTANYMLMYAKNKKSKPLNKVYIRKGYDKGYSKILISDRSEPFSSWKWLNVVDVFSDSLGYKSSKEAKKDLGDEFDQKLAKFAIENSHNIFQLVAISGGAKSKRLRTITESSRNKGKVYVHPGEDIDDFYILNGRQMAFYDSRIIELNGERFPAEICTDVWVDVSWNGIAKEGGVSLKNGKKPELLLERVIEMTTGFNDIVLDFHLGSGTTSAVAQKMGRRWIGVEQMDYIDEITQSRMKNVVSGEQSGVSKKLNWLGGGSFIRADLLTWNESLVTRIRGASSIEDLDTIRADMLENGYLRHDLYRDELEAADLNEPSLEDAKALLIGCLDLNHLYVNIGDMADPTYGVSDEDQRLNRAFQEGDE